MSTILAAMISADYFVDSSGQLYSIKKGQIRRLKTHLNDCGYPKINLRINGKNKKYFVHRLVLIAFRGNRSDKMQVRHLDNNRTNSALTNLRWSTKAENEADKRIFGTLPSKITTTLTEQDVIEIRKLSQELNYTQMARMYGCDRMTISRIVRRVWRKKIA